MNFVMEQFLLKDRIEIFEIESLIVKFITSHNRIEIIKHAYDASKRNIEYISDVFDQDLLKQLNDEISEYDGFEWN